MPPFGNAQLKLLERLCNVIAVSGDEAEVRRIVLEEIRPYAQEVKVDALGNVLAVRSGRGRTRRLVPRSVSGVSHLPRRSQHGVRTRTAEAQRHLIL